MNPSHLTITGILIIAQLILPRKYGFIPLIIAALHTSQFAVIPSFSSARLVIVAGLAKIIISGDFKWSAKNPIDILFLSFAFFTIASAFGQSGQYVNPYSIRIRMALDVCGTFLYAKSYITNFEEYKNFAKAICIITIPLALGMLYTKLTGQSNPYSIVGGTAYTLIRNDTIRAVGPFGTPILAGTIGALLIPTVYILRKEHKTLFIIGTISCVTIIFSAGSSTPIGSLLICCAALYLWKWRTYTKLISRTSLCLLIILHLAWDKPIWYLIAKTDFVGGSTGWHRSYLIDMAAKHFSEWWFMGTEYTRHWMPYGLPEVPWHCDLTNYYINLGVFGGLPLMLTLLLIIVRSFGSIKKSLHTYKGEDEEKEAIIWSIGALLFTHTLTCLTISYFDQSYIIFYFLIAFISNLDHNRESHFKQEAIDPLHQRLTT